MITPDPELVEFLRDSGLAGEDERGDWTPLGGGVSSDIWRVETQKGVFCLKRALAQLKVPTEWRAPVARNATEWAYMEVVSTIAPGSVPRPIAHDSTRGLFAMDWLPPDRYALWKTDLMAGRGDVAFAGKVGSLLGRIHAATARDPSLRGRFATDENFEALRIDPYLKTTARAHPDLADIIADIADTTVITRKVLVHGDVSPKNILCGPDGPVFLDAECGWFGDPAFDLDFCLNHLVIKAQVLEASAEALRTAFNTLTAAYFAEIDWEPFQDLESRAARLLPALTLARVDGKSPVEYLNETHTKSLRALARGAVAARPTTLEDARVLLSMA